MTETESDITISLIDVSGKELMIENHLISQGNNEITMNLGKITKGFYLLALKKEGIKTVFSKLIYN